jgi:hypothetical protein
MRWLRMLWLPAGTCRDRIRTMRRGVAGRLRFPLGRLLLVLALARLGTAEVAAQDIRIRVLNGRNGRPVSDQCLNVWVAGKRMFDAVIPTDGGGIAVFHLAGDPNNRVQEGRCKGVAAPYPAVTHAEAIQTVPAWPVDCQPYKKIRPHQYSPPPSYSVEQILATGLVARNSCGKVNVSARPGELIVFTRALRPWEWIVWAWEL